MLQEDYSYGRFSKLSMPSTSRIPAYGYPNEAKLAAFSASLGKTHVLEVLSEHAAVHGDFQPQTGAYITLLRDGLDAFLRHPGDFYPRITSDGQTLVYAPKTEAFRGDVFEDRAIGFAINSGDRRDHPGQVDPSLEIWLLGRNGDEWIRQAGVELNAGVPLNGDSDHVPVRGITMFAGDYDLDIPFNAHPSTHSFNSLVGFVRSQIQAVIDGNAQKKYTVTT